jgi:hypothetical protein
MGKTDNLREVRQRLCRRAEGKFDRNHCLKRQRTADEAIFSGQTAQMSWRDE